ncbi:MAG: class I SAM-dependent methyltransferase [Candidatus Dependentiae bacterium]
MNTVKFHLIFVASICSAVLLNADRHENVFSNIYHNAVWGKNAQGEGFSGGGSLLANCLEYNHFVEKFMREHNIRSVVDAGCGDWESTRYIDWNGIDYFGCDVVESVINKNIKRFGSSNIHFEFGNLVTMDLPSADLLVCKHVLQHLPNEDIKRFLPQLKKYKYCLIINEVYPHNLSSDNPDIQVGGGHKIDLRKAPFFIDGTPVMNFRIGNAVHQIFLIDNTK